MIKVHAIEKEDRDELASRYGKVVDARIALEEAEKNLEEQKKITIRKYADNDGRKREDYIYAPEPYEFGDGWSDLLERC